MITRQHLYEEARKRCFSSELEKLKDRNEKVFFKRKNHFYDIDNNLRVIVPNFNIEKYYISENGDVKKNQFLYKTEEFNIKFIVYHVNSINVISKNMSGWDIVYDKYGEIIGTGYSYQVIYSYLCELGLCD